MAYVDGCKNDIFVSYAHADNLGGPTAVNWVSQFAGFLDTCVQQRLGCGDCLRVYFDHRDLSANHELEGLVAEVQQSAVFVAVTSPSYVAREWTRKELDAFCRVPNFQQRLFAIEMLPLDSLSDYPPPLDGKSRARFWHRPGQDSRTAITLDPNLDRQMYTQKLLDLAAQIRNALLEQHTTASRPAAAVTPPAATDTMGTVLLAQTTDELELEREQVKAFLLQMGVTVLPDGDYPQGGDAFVEALKADLERTNVYVQLLGKAVGRRPPDLPEGYVQCQFRLATEASTAMLLWRHPGIDMDSIGEGAQRDTLLNEAVIASGLESFKTDVLKTLEKVTAPAKPSHTSLIYLGAERSDLPIAEEMQQALTKRSYPVVIPTFEGSSEEIRQDLEENLMESDTLVFVHGSAPATWVRGNLRRLHKLLSMRDKPPRKVAIFKAPPREKPGIGVSLPYVEMIDSSSGIDIELLLSKLEDRS